MTHTNNVTPSHDQVLQQLAAAVRNDDRAEFCTQTQLGVALFGGEVAADLLNKQLPLILDVKYIPRQLQLMTGEDDYIATVQSFLAELTQVMATEGFAFGVEFSYGEADGVPYLAMTEATALKVENLYAPHAWKQCLPYLRIS